MVNARRRTPVFQRGNALMVSLVFLVILTTLGVSVAGTGRLELMMAANTQFGNQAYQAAESGIDSVLRIDPNVIKGIVGSGGTIARSYFFNPTTSAGGFDDPSTPASTIFAEQAVTTTTLQGEIIYCYNGDSLGTDLGLYQASIDSRSQSQRGGRARHEQGFCFRGPSGAVP